MTEEVLINLSLTIPEINYILALIAERPYKECGGLMEKLRAQAVPQAPVAPVGASIKESTEKEIADANAIADEYEHPTGDESA